jgi:hypothetical protein
MGKRAHQPANRRVANPLVSMFSSLT